MVSWLSLPVREVSRGYQSLWRIAIWLLVCRQSELEMCVVYGEERHGYGLMATRYIGVLSKRSI